MPKIKPLVWVKGDAWVANSPSVRSGSLTIFFEEGRYWPTWEGSAIPGHDTLEAAQAEGQKLHDDYISQFLF